jgi:hypothetical protein
MAIITVMPTRANLNKKKSLRDCFQSFSDFFFGGATSTTNLNFGKFR